MSAKMQTAQLKMRPYSQSWTVWFTGLSGAGKSTLASGLSAHLENLSLAHEVLDGDAVRSELCRDLGFSKEDRDENVRRIGYVAQMLNRHGVIAVVAAISPYRLARSEVRQKCSSFIEVHVDCPLSTLAARDVKGLYKKAMTGQLPHFSGVSDPYERPIRPDIYLNSAQQTKEESLRLLVDRLQEFGCLAGCQDRFAAKSMPA